jgi:hypothetical protein
MTTLKIIVISLLISAAPATNGFANDKPARPPKQKTRVICKMVMPKPQPGPWTVINQVPVKVCRTVVINSPSGK